MLPRVAIKRPTKRLKHGPSMLLIPLEDPKDLTIRTSTESQFTLTAPLARKMRKVTLQQELQAATILQQAKWEKMGGWKDPTDAFKPAAHPLKEVLEDIRNRRNPYLERKDPAFQLLRQSIYRSKINRVFKKLALQKMPTHTRSLKVALSDINNRRAPYFERNDPAKKVRDAIKRIGLNGQIKQVVSSKVKFEADRSVLLNGIQKKAQDMHDTQVHTEKVAPPAFLEDIRKQPRKVTPTRNYEKEDYEINLCPELETVLFDEDDFSTFNDARTDPVLHYLSSLEQMVADLSHEVQFMRSQMQELIEYSKKVSTGHFQEATFMTGTSNIVLSAAETIGQTEDMGGMIPISAVVVEDHEDWVDVL